jgi:dihydrofolate reductase
LLRLKHGSGRNLAVLGSGTIVAQLAAADLIDEYQMLIVPVVPGRGRTLFETINRRLHLQLIRSRVFGNGNVLLCYEPVIA